MSNEFVAEGVIDLDTATIQGQIDCRRGALPEPWICCSASRWCARKRSGHFGEAFLEPEEEERERAFLARGCVCLVGARLDGSLQCSGGTFIEKTGNRY